MSDAVFVAEGTLIDIVDDAWRAEVLPVEAIPIPPEHQLPADEGAEEVQGTQQHPVGSQRPLRRHAMEASSARLRSGGASSSALSGKRLQIAARKRPTSAGTRKRVVVAAARGSDGGWLLGRGARVLAFALFKARKARRGDGIQSVFAKALGGRRSIDAAFKKGRGDVVAPEDKTEAPEPLVEARDAALKENLLAASMKAAAEKADEREARQPHRLTRRELGMATLVSQQQLPASAAIIPSGDVIASESPAAAAPARVASAPVQATAAAPTAKPQPAVNPFSFLPFGFAGRKDADSAAPDASAPRPPAAEAAEEDRQLGRFEVPWPFGWGSSGQPNSTPQLPSSADAAQPRGVDPALPEAALAEARQQPLSGGRGPSPGVATPAAPAAAAQQRQQQPEQPRSGGLRLPSWVPGSSSQAPAPKPAAAAATATAVAAPAAPAPVWDSPRPLPSPGPPTINPASPSPKGASSMPIGGAPVLGQPRLPFEPGLFVNLASVAWHLWPRFAIAVTAQLLGAMVFLATPRAFGRVLDSVSTGAGGFTAAVLVLGSLYAGQCFAALFQTWLLADAVEALSTTLRSAVFRAGISQDVGYFDSASSGELTSRLSSDVAQVASSVSSSARGTRAVVEATGALIVLSLTSLKLTLVACTVVPFVVALSQRFGVRVKQLSKRAQAALASSQALAEESFLNVRTIKAFSREHHAASRYDAAAERAYRLAARIALQTGFLEGLTRAAGNVSALVILAFGGSLVAAGELSVGALTSFVIYTLYISSALGNVSSCYAEVMRAEGAGARLFALLRKKSEIEETIPPSGSTLSIVPSSSGRAAFRVVVEAAPLSAAAASADAPPPLAFAEPLAVPPATPAPAQLRQLLQPLLQPQPPAPELAPPPAAELRLALSGVRFAFPSRPQLVLDGVDIEIAPGQVTALVGPSGSGKSTVAALLQRFYDPLEGSVTLNGRDVRTLSPMWLRSQLATVSQEPALFNGTVAENIAYGAPVGSHVTQADILAAAKAANADQFIREFPQGYATQLGERGVTLSGGQRQRLAIARAILKNAPVLLLDEATSALDMTSEGLVQEALERLTKGRTTLVIAHRLAALRNADVIYVLDGGKVVEKGNHQQLVQANGLYSRMYRLGNPAGRLADWAVKVPTLLAARVGKQIEEAAARRKEAQLRNQQREEQKQREAALRKLEAQQKLVLKAQQQQGAAGAQPPHGPAQSQAHGGKGASGHGQNGAHSHHKPGQGGKH